MLFFVPEATFTQQLVMYSFFIGMPILLIAFVVYVGIKSVKQNNETKKCLNCREFIFDDSDFCKDCKNEFD